MEKHEERSCTWFLEKYGGISIYYIDIERRYTIDDKCINFIKKYVYASIGNPDNPYGNSTDNEYFLIHDDLFDRILSTEQNSDILLVINKYVSFTSINENGTYSRSKLRNRYEIVSYRHQLNRKIQKKVQDYSHKYIDCFKLIVVNPLPKLPD